MAHASTLPLDLRKTTENGRRVPKLHFLVDFDGTITEHDTTDYLLERFAHRSWEEVEAAWVAGEIGSAECLARQVALITATPGELKEALDEIRIDPDFQKFTDQCAEDGHGITIVSDGLDFSIQHKLASFDQAFPVFSNALHYEGDSRWSLTSPFSAPPHGAQICDSRAGTCKCKQAQHLIADFKVLIGDGRSDFCVSAVVDHVLAKSTLNDHCKSLKIPHTPVKGFDDALLFVNHVKNGTSALSIPSAIVRQI